MEFAVRLWAAICGPSRHLLLAPGPWVTVGGPISTLILINQFKVPLLLPTAFLTMMALLFGGYLSAFVHYSTLRSRLTETQDVYDHAEAPERMLADSVAALLLAGATSSVVATAYTAVSVSVVGIGGLVGWPASLAWTLSSVPFFLFLYTVPLLFRGYQQLVATRTGACSY